MASDSKGLNPALIEDIDRRVKSPQERAQEIWSALQRYCPKAFDWDIICFCIEYLGMMSQTPTYSFLEVDAKSINRIVYRAHYERFAATATKHHERGSITNREPERYSPKSLFESDSVGRSREEPKSLLHIRDNDSGGQQDRSEENARQSDDTDPRGNEG